MEADILLCDLDAFFASVEQRDHPDYRGRPVIVGGRAEARGVVSTCSYEARAYGVRSAMPMATARRLCPHAVFLPVNMRRYREVSGQVFAVFDRFTPFVEQVSVDEAYLAVPRGQGMEVARGIRRQVRAELGLAVSVGVSVNKLLAKVACGLGKPDGLRELWPEQVAEVLWPLPVGVLPGVGPRTGQKLERIGIATVGQLAVYPVEALQARLGSWGRLLWEYAHGLDGRPLELEHRVKSISEETTFPADVVDLQRVLSTIMLLAEEVGYRLRKKNLRARTVGVKIRWSDFSTTTRSRTLPGAVDSDMAIFGVARELFLAHRGQPPWRLVGVEVSGLQEWEQPALFDAQAEREARLQRAVDRLRGKYGRPVIQRASSLLAEEKE